MLYRINILSQNIKANRTLAFKEKLPVLLVTSDDKQYGCYRKKYVSRLGLSILSDRASSKVWIEDDVPISNQSSLRIGAKHANWDKRVKTIHVNQHHLLHNKKVGRMVGTKYKPLITVKIAGKAIYCDSVNVLGGAELVYLDSALSCGAEVVVITKADIVVSNPSCYEK